MRKKYLFPRDPEELWRDWKLYPYEVAAHPEAPAELLEKLSLFANDSIRKAIARNPGAPLHLLFLIAEEFPKEFLYENPLIALYLIEDFCFIMKLPNRTLVAILRLPDISKTFLELLSTHSSQNVLAQVASHWNIPKETLNALGKKNSYFPSYSLSCALVQNSNFRRREARNLIISDRGRVLAAILRQRKIDARTLSIVREAAVSFRFSWEIEREARKQLMDPDISISLLKQIARLRIRDLGAAIRRNPRVPSSVIKILSEDFVPKWMRRKKALQKKKAQKRFALRVFIKGKKKTTGR